MDGKDLEGYGDKEIAFLYDKYSGDCSHLVVDEKGTKTVIGPLNPKLLPKNRKEIILAGSCLYLPNFSMF